MTDDNADDGMFDEFADATEAKLAIFAEQIRGFRNEIERMREEQRSAPVLATQPIIDTDAIATRAAALVPPPVIDLEAIGKRAAELVPAPSPGKDGKDAVVDTEGIIARVAELAIPRISAAIPAPKDGEPGKDGLDGKDAPAINTEEIIARIAELAIPRITAAIPVPANGKDGAPGERGADGIATREEIEEIVIRQFTDVQTRTLADSCERTFVPGTRYKRGAITTWSRGSWLAMVDTEAAPGTSPDWQLLAAAGRDGRDRTART